MNIIVGNTYQNGYRNRETILLIQEDGLRRASSGRLYRSDGRHAPGGVPSSSPGPADLVEKVTCDVVEPESPTPPAHPDPCRQLIRRSAVRAYALACAEEFGLDVKVTKPFVDAAEEHLASWVAARVSEARKKRPRAPRVPEVRVFDLPSPRH